MAMKGWRPSWNEKFPGSPATRVAWIVSVSYTHLKLPLSYFSRHDLSDLAQTIMADVAAIEHAMSHAMAKAVGFLFFFPLLSVLLLLGNVKLGLAIILPILL